MTQSLIVRESNGLERASLAERAARQARTYWKIRSAKALEMLEHEARKMLQLEEELGAFALQYEAALGEHARRLAALDVELQLAASGGADLESMPAVDAQCRLHASRRRELKARYRKLAKEIHPDRAAISDSAGAEARHMHRLNGSYQKGDLAGLLRLEAELILNQMASNDATNDLEICLRDIERAADTYAQGYRALLTSPINALMLRALSARLEGWDWLDAVIRRLARAVAEKERMLVMANLIAISDWPQVAGNA